MEGESGSPERRAHRAPLAAAVRSSMAGPSEALRETRRSEVEGESGSPERRAHRAPLAAAVRSSMAGPSEALRGARRSEVEGRVRISGEEGAQGSVGSSSPGNKNPGAETVTGGTTILLKKRDSSLSLHNRLTKAQRVPQERAMRGPKFMTRSLLHRAMK